MVERTYSVLVVDDSSVNRSYLHYILDEEGYRVLEARSGEDCLEAVRTDRPRLVLLDVIMGGMDGFETLGRLKADPAVATIPVIMLTSLEDQTSKLRAFELGAVDYIVKSADAAEIKARVRVHIRLSLANQELMRSRAESVSKISAAQHALLARPEDVPGASFAGYYQALHEAGGDFYDVVAVAEDVHFYLLADVAGHDVGTSFITPAVKVLLKQFATPAYSVEETIGYMSEVLAQTVCRDTYLTAAALRINRRSLKAVHLSAGHPPMVYIPVEGPCTLVECKNPPLGMMEGIPFHTDTLDLRRGDKFLLFTDGLVELAAPDGRGPVPWTAGVADLMRRVEEFRDISLTELPSALVSAMVGSGPLDDDIAILAVEV